MNQELENQIAKEVFSFLMPSFVEKEGKPRLIDKKISVELEDGEKQEHIILGSSGKCGPNKIDAIVVDLSDSEVEYDRYLLFRVDDLSAYILKESEGAIYCFYEEKIVRLPPVPQAKLLLAIAHIREMGVEWAPLQKYDSLYKSLVMFLNYEESSK